MSNTYRLLTPFLPNITKLYSNKEHSIVIAYKINKYICFTAAQIYIYVLIDNSNKIIIELYDTTIKTSELGTELQYNNYACFLQSFPFLLNKDWKFLQGFRGFYYQNVDNKSFLYWNVSTQDILVNWIKECHYYKARL